MTSYDQVIENLSRARTIADYAERLGISETPVGRRHCYSHIGAVLADAALQAGLNYRTVVRPRIDRIQVLYPQAATLSGVNAVVQREGPGTFLNWHHATKVDRFVRLIEILDGDDIQTVSELRTWLSLRETRGRLLELHGIGPKTYDYVCCISGMDHIAVDRHIKNFVSEAGVSLNTYPDLQVVVSFAADLLGLARRDFDAWIWERLASRHVSQDAFAFG